MKIQNNAHLHQCSQKWEKKKPKHTKVSKTFIFEKEFGFDSNLILVFNLLATSSQQIDSVRDVEIESGSTTDTLMEIEDKGNDGNDDEQSEASGASKRKLIFIIQTKDKYFRVKIDRCQLSLIFLNSFLASDFSNLSLLGASNTSSSNQGILFTACVSNQSTATVALTTPTPTSTNRKLLCKPENVDLK